MSDHSKPKVVFDSGVVLSALLFTGKLSWLIGHWQSGDCLPLISRATAAELTTILAYSKFRLSVDEQFEALDSYILSCEIVEITQVCPVLCRAPKDQPFLDLAHSGKAEVLVTGDADLLALIGETEFVIETPEAYRQRVIVYE